MHHIQHPHPTRSGVDMTEGNITGHLIRFALPLLAGNIFQQLYNMVDTWVVGNFVSNEAFSAVGTVGPIVNMLIGCFLGFSSGAGVVISQYYGARRTERVHDAVHTALVLTVILCAVFTALGIGFTPLMLRLMNTPAEVFPESSAYLTIYFGGISGLLIYNMGSGILRAVGDSRRPFYFLVVSAVLNTALDLLFVLRFGMGVEGVAWATVIAQAVSALLVIVVLLRTQQAVRLIPRDLRIHLPVLRQIIRVGVPSALQMAITAFSNVFVQSYINSFGADCMGGLYQDRPADAAADAVPGPVRHYLCGAESGPRQRAPCSAGRAPCAGHCHGRHGAGDDSGAGLFPADDGLFQPEAGGGGLRRSAAAVYLPLLCAVLLQSGLRSCPAGRRKQ